MFQILLFRLILIPFYKDIDPIRNGTFTSFLAKFARRPSVLVLKTKRFALRVGARELFDQKNVNFGSDITVGNWVGFPRHSQYMKFLGSHKFG